jgi:hypothetical protein
MADIARARIELDRHLRDGRCVTDADAKVCVDHARDGHDAIRPPSLTVVSRQRYLDARRDQVLRQPRARERGHRLHESAGMNYPG